MKIGIADHVIVPSPRLVRRPRTGVVVAIVGSATPCYRVRWDDGHVSDLRPASGALALDPEPPRPLRPGVVNVEHDIPILP